MKEPFRIPDGSESIHFLSPITQNSHTYMYENFPLPGVWYEVGTFLPKTVPLLEPSLSREKLPHFSS